MKLRNFILKLIFSSQFIVTAALLLLLPLLAALQYRWLGQLSVSEREQRRAHLRTLATRFGQDFDREITRTYISFLPFSEAEETDWLNAYALNYARWSKSATYPGLIKNVYVAVTDEQQQLHPHLLNHQTGFFDVCDWPPQMMALQKQLQELAHRETRRLNLPSSGSPPPDRADNSGKSPIPFADEPPAMALPILESGRIQSDGRLSPPHIAGIVLIELDVRYIQQEMLPALAGRHFLAEDGSSYDLIVVSNNNQRIIYNSGAAAGQSLLSPVAITNADADASLFSLLADEFRDLMRNNRRLGEMRVRINPALRPRAAPPIFFGAREWMAQEQSGLWKMYIRHRAGSLEAAVASVHRRNLLISFGILALLASSVVLMMLSSRRAHRLARQQMDFVAGISHELRTPLSVIESAAFNLDKGVVKNPQQIKSYGTLIRKETGRLTEMIEQVLEFAGVQSGQQRYELLPVRLNSVIEDVLVDSRHLFTEAGFQVEANIAPNLPTVMADQAAIARAIQNLLNNAMKYSGESRWIGLRAETNSLGSGQFVMITVEDRGLGIPDKELPHIFEPFYRGSEARSAQIRGNGLGLSLVKNIIEAHGGQIQAKSKTGSGSSFFLRLPVMNQVSELKPTAEIEMQTGLPDAKL